MIDVNLHIKIPFFFLFVMSYIECDIHWQPVLEELREPNSKSINMQQRNTSNTLCLLLFETF